MSPATFTKSLNDAYLLDECLGRDLLRRRGAEEEEVHDGERGRDGEAWHEIARGLL